MHTVKVSREKDVDLLFAGLKRNSEAVTRIGARLVLQQQPAAPAYEERLGAPVGRPGSKKDLSGRAAKYVDDE